MYGGVSQKIASRKASAYTGGGTVQKLKFLALAHATSPFITVYYWDGGFGAKVSNPATLPPAQCNDVSFTSNGDAIIMTHNNSPYISAYPWSNSGFGTKFSDPATLATGDAQVIRIRSGNGAVMFAHSNSPFVSAYPWSTSGFGTKYSNPGTLPNGYYGDCAFDNDGDRAFVIKGQAQGNLSYSFSTSTGFGSDTGQFALLAQGVSFAPNGTAFAITNHYGFSFAAYAYNSSTNTTGDTRYQPASAPSFFPKSSTWSNNSNAIVACGPSSEVNAYPWNNPGFGTKFSAPSPAPGGTVSRAAFTPDDAYIAIAHGNSPYVSVYAWSNSTGFGTKVSDPTSLPAGAGQGVAFIHMP